MTGVAVSRIFLIGNPNCGKTSLFNAITGEQRPVGNWPGVTVERVEGRRRAESRELVFTDLPGAYSLRPASPDEAVLLGALDEASRGIIVNVIDAGNLERNLFLTLQLLEIGLKPLIALNFTDSLAERGGKIDLARLADALGCPVFPTVGRTGEGTEALIREIVRRSGFASETDLQSSKKDDAEGLSSRSGEVRGIPIHDIRPAAEDLGVLSPTQRLAAISGTPCSGSCAAERSAGDLPEAGSCPPNSTRDCRFLALAEARYLRIMEILAGCYSPPPARGDRFTEVLDRSLVGRWTGLPVLFVVMFLVFWTTFALGEHPAGYIRSLVPLFQGWFRQILPAGAVGSLVVDGLVPGVGGVMVFLPNILILFTWVILLEDSGYLSRAAFLTDRIMQTLGLHGRAFIPMVMSFGCSVPAVLATRILEDGRQRLLTIFLVPMVACSARLPLLVLLCGAFFPERPGFWLFLLYFSNVCAIVFLGNIASRFIGSSEPSPFLFELPPYRIPSLRNLRLQLWEKVLHFLGKAGSVILCGSVLIWGLSWFPREVPLSRDYDAEKRALETQSPSPERESRRMALDALQSGEEMERRYLGRLGKALLPLVEPLGFGWREAISLIPGFLAKESIVSTLSILYQPVSSDLGEAMRKSGKTPLQAFVFMLFTVLYIPCLSTIGVIYRETGSARFTLVALVSPGVIAWVSGFLVFRLFPWTTAAAAAWRGQLFENLTVILAVALAAWIMIRTAWNRFRGGGCGGCDGKKGCTTCSRAPGPQARPVGDPRILS